MGRAEILEQIHRRRVTHEAGHAVASVARGGELIEFSVTFDAFTDAPPDHPRVVHTAARGYQPFVCFAGMWADARFRMDADRDGSLLFSEALEVVVSENSYSSGDADKLRGLGLDLDIESPPGVWLVELEGLWPAMLAVTQRFIKTGAVDHADVRAAIAEVTR